MIDGLKLTLTGEDLRSLLQDRADEHRKSAERWDREAVRTPDDQTEDAPLLPDQMCQHEAERHEWRADVLEFLRDHLEPLEVYRLGESDLGFGELLPPKPGIVEQAEYEEEGRVGFALERLGRRVCDFPEIFRVTNPDWSGNVKRQDDDTVSR